MSARRPKAPTARDCPVCGSDMTGKPNRVRTCSRRCAGKARTKRARDSIEAAARVQGYTGETWEAVGAEWGFPSLAAFERAAYRAQLPEVGNAIRRERYRLEREELKES